MGPPLTVDVPEFTGTPNEDDLMVTYGSAAAAIRVNRAVDAALVWAAASSIVLSITAASFAAKPKHRTMPTASAGVAMN